MSVGEVFTVEERGAGDREWRRGVEEVQKVHMKIL